MFFRLSLVTLACAIAAFGTPVQRDLLHVEADLRWVTRLSEALDKSVVAFPQTGGTYNQVLAIHGKAMTLHDAIQHTARHARDNSVFTDPDANTVIGLVMDLGQVITQGCKDLVAKKSDINAVSPCAIRIAELDLEQLKSDTEDLGKAVLTHFPKDKKDAGMEQITTIVNVISATIQEYSTN